MAPRFIDHDPVDSLIKRLPSQYQSILEMPQDAVATRNALRLLGTKAPPVGSFGSYDRIESRAAVLLEYVVRSRVAASGGGGAGATTTLKHKDLGKLVGVKENNFRKLHTAIGHYYFDLEKASRKESSTRKSSFSETKSAERNSKRKQSPQQQQQQVARNKSRRRGEISQSMLPSLAIRLASHLKDPNGMARRARILFHQVHAHALACLPTAVDKRGQEHDFCRYAAAYQAAVLFFVATQDELSSRAGGAVRSNGGEQEESGNRPLKLEDLVKACPECTYMDLREKVACVEKWAKELQRKQQPSSQTTVRAKSKKSALLNTAINGSHDHAASLSGAKETEEEDEPSFDFVQWKESILAPVLERTKAKAAESDEQNPLHRQTLLILASDAILAKYGLC